MKRVIAVIMASCLCMGLLAGCGNKDNSSTKTEKENVSAMEEEATAPSDTTGESGAEIAVFVSTQSTGIDDRGFAQISWETVKSYGDANGITYAWYQPADSSVESYLETVQVAVNNGAKVGVFVGFQFLDCAAQAQWLYPDVDWIAIDVSGVESADERGLNDNMYATNFLVQEGAFLLGASAVYEGYENMGIITPYNIAACTRYGYGFVQGANWAAGELGIDNISIKHYFLGNQDASPENQAVAASWYETGTDLIFANAGGASVSIYAAAEASNAECMAVDVDCYYLSDTIIASAIKDVERVISDALDAYYAGEFPGGKVVNAGIVEGAVGIPFDNARYKNFTEEDYNTIAELLKNDTDGIRSNIIDSLYVDDMSEMWNQISDHHIDLQIIE